MMKKILVCMLFMAMCILPHTAFSAKIIHLTTFEKAPYIGEDLPDNGYAYEFVAEIFKRAGYEVQISYYPLARAIYMAEEGEVDGVLPLYYDASLAKNMIFSEPFPGGTLGLLKRKNQEIKFIVDPRKNQTEALRNLRAYRFGVRRGASHTPEFDQASFLKKEEVADDAQNLLKLFNDRIDFAVMDKYTAADLMVNTFPQMIGQLEFLAPPLSEQPFHIAFSKKSQNYQQLVNDFNRSLQEAEQEHLTETILYKHGLLDKTNLNPEKTIIRIGTVDNPDMMIMQQLSKIYEQQHPGIQLEWNVLEEDILRLRLLSDLAISDGKFDIMTIGAYETPIWAKNERLTSFENLPESYDVTDILQSVRDALSYNDTLYALPFYAESTMTFYRKDLFEKAGLTMPDTPTYQDIQRAAAAIHDPANQVYGICLRGKPAWGENMAFISQLINTFGGRWFDETWQPTIDSPEWKEAITYYKEIMNHYGTSQASLNGFTEILSLFSSGHCGIWIDATVAAGILYNPKTSQVADNVGFAHAPVAVTPKGSHWLWSWALAIPVSSKQQEEARKFILWATSKEYIELVAAQEGWISVPPGTRVSTYQNSNYKTQAPFADLVLQSIQTANPNDNTLKPTPYNGIQYVSIPEFPSLGRQIGKIMARILDGEISVEAALKESQELALYQMKASGYIK